MTRAPAPHRSIAPAFVLAAGLISAVLIWLSLTTVRLMSQAAVVALTVAVLVPAGVVARRHRGPQRWIAVSGGLIALLPLLVVAGFLSVSGG